MENVKETIELDDDEMERYAIACMEQSVAMAELGKKYEAHKYLFLWAKMTQAKERFQERAGRELSEKYLGNKEKPTPGRVDFSRHIVLDGPILPQS